jgi:hypothetical protein
LRRNSFTSATTSIVNETIETAKAADHRAQQIRVAVNRGNIMFEEAISACERIVASASLAPAAMIGSLAAILKPVRVSLFRTDTPDSAAGHRSPTQPGARKSLLS